MIRTIMSYSGVPSHVVIRFTTNNGKVIGQNAALDIANKVTNFLKNTIKPGETIIIKKIVQGGKVTSSNCIITEVDLALVRTFVIYNKNSCPYEIW